MANVVAEVEETVLCDYCKGALAILHYWRTGKNSCGDVTCEKRAREEAKSAK